jgi:hypothetical protein
VKAIAKPTATCSIPHVDFDGLLVSSELSTVSLELSIVFFRVPFGGLFGVLFLGVGDEACSSPNGVGFGVGRGWGSRVDGGDMVRCRFAMVVAESVEEWKYFRGCLVYV